MTAYDITLGKLVSHPEFRERSKRGIYLAKLALRFTELETRFEVGEQQLTLKEMSDFAIKYATFERAWRQVLQQEENKHLRGSDYSQGEILAQERELSLGYEPNYHADIKKLKTV